MPADTSLGTLGAAAVTRTSRPPPLPSARPQRSPERVVLSRTARVALRSGVLWGYLFGVVVASSALTYHRFYPTAAARLRLAASFGSNHATAALFGPAPQLQTAAGFTAFKSSMTLMVLGAVWGLLAGTRLLRGEEEAGRWELLLSGWTTAGRATAQALAGMAAGAAALWALSAVIVVAVGRFHTVGWTAAAGLYFSLALAATPVMFLAVGALTSQLAATRRRAAAYAAWFLGAAYALRMVGDSGVGLHALVWVSPLGWVEELQPLTAPQPAALLPIAVFTAAAAVAAVLLAARRDVGASVVADRTHAKARLGLLSGQVGLTVRLVRPVVVAWWLALGVTGLLLGSIAKTAGASLSGSSVATVFSRLGAHGMGVRAYLGVSFMVVSVLVAFMAAGQVAAARQEEAQGRLDHLVVRPTARWAWLLGRCAVAAAAVVVAALGAGALTWLGVASHGGGVGLGPLLGAAVGAACCALCLLGVGIFVFGVRPDATSGAVYAVLGWSLLVEVVGGFGSVGHWLVDLSLFHQVTGPPATGPDWTVDAVLVGIAVAAAAIGGWAFGRRDLRGE